MSTTRTWPTLVPTGASPPTHSSKGAPSNRGSQECVALTLPVEKETLGEGRATRRSKNKDAREERIKWKENIATLKHYIKLITGVWINTVLNPYISLRIVEITHPQKEKYMSEI